MRGARLALGAGLALAAAPALAQKAPEAGYVYPPGARAGSTVEVRLGGYDWTPDMQAFTLDPRVKLELTGAPGPMFVPPPPYWFGAKAYLPALPLPREFPARFTLPADLPPGVVRWQAANANGSTATGVFLVTAPADGDTVAEGPRSRKVQAVPLPSVVQGRLSRIEEVDRYRFTPARTGPVTVELLARRLGADFHGVLEVRDADGRLVADTADTSGSDAGLTFAAKAGTEYTVALHDVDFRGDRSYVYALKLRPGSRVLAALPAAGPAGETRPVEFLLDTGGREPARVKQEVRFPQAPEGSRFTHLVQAAGEPPAPFSMRVSALPESMAQPMPGAVPLAAPGAVTGTLDAGRAEARFQVTAKAGEVWKIAAESRALGSWLDLSLRVFGPDGKEAAANDDLPGTTDAGLEYTVPADGPYTLAVSDLSGRQSAGAGIYRLSVERAAPGFRLQSAQQLSVPLGGTADLVVRVTRTGGFKEPISLKVSGLPEGVTAPAEVPAPAGAAEVKIPLRCAPDAPVTAALVRAAGSAVVGGAPVTQPVLAPAAGVLVASSPDESLVPEIMVAVTMKPVCKVEPVDKDGGRRIHRGASYAAPVIVTRMEGFQGDVQLWMSARQSYTCMGIAGPDIVVPAGVSRTTYPCFMPEWLETSRTSRMILVAVAKVPDPRGRVRHLVSLMDGRITMSMEGALLKVTSPPAERVLRPGAGFKVPVKLARSPELRLPVRVELVLPEELAGLVKAEPLVLASDQNEGEVVLTSTADPALLGEQSITLRATAMRPGDLAVVSEVAVPVVFTEK